MNNEPNREDPEILEEPDDQSDSEVIEYNKLDEVHTQVPESDDDHNVERILPEQECGGVNLSQEKGGVRIDGVRKSMRIKERREMGLHVSLKKAIKMYGKDAYAAIRKELQQMVDRSVWIPIKLEDLSKHKYKRIIRSSMFLKEKFLSNGDFEKLKARFVAGGNMQEKELYDSVASPTISTVAVFILLALAAMDNKHLVVSSR